MAYSNDKSEGIRTNEEAWDLALDNRGLMYKILGKYVQSHGLPYYSGEALRAELEGPAWEALYHACKHWDEKKATLGTFAWKSVVNGLNARMKVLARMGSSLQGGNTKGVKMPRPALSSIEGMNARKAETVGNGDLPDNYADTLNQPWAVEEVSMEDEIIDTIDRLEKVERIKRVVEQMSEPHKTVFTLAYFEEPTHERMENTSKTSGLTMHEIADRYGRSTTWVKHTLEEATEYIQWQIGDEDEDS